MDHHTPGLVKAPGAWSDAEWEAAWAPYDESTYEAALRFIRPNDIVLDIGAGDLRFARRAARIARTVIAIERRSDWLTESRPANLTVIHGDALEVPFPELITVAVLLMRHCRRFAQYVARLQAVGCERLITNARWGMGVECASLRRQPAYGAIEPGWYACWCGAIGFKPDAPERITPDTLARVSQVATCPTCEPR